MTSIAINLHLQITKPTTKSSPQSTNHGMPWVLQEEDIPYEQLLSQDPYNESNWLEYAENTLDKHHRAGILNRATATLPASTLLWNAYFETAFHDKTALKGAYEKALRVLNTSPSIWNKYLRLLIDEKKEHIKQVFDSALFNLPTFYHGEVWKLYLAYAGSTSGESEETIAQIYIQAIKAKALDIQIPVNAFTVIDAVLRSGNASLIRELWGFIWQRQLGSDAPKQLADYLLHSKLFLLVDEDLFNELCDDFALRLPTLKSLVLVRKARYYEDRDVTKARYFYSLALSLVTTASDVSKAFNEFVDFEDSLLDSLDEDELETRLNILETFINRRPFLINDVKLRASPNNVDVWLERAAIFGNDNAGKIKTLVDALMNVNPLEATGQKSLVDVWDEYAKVYLDLGDIKTAVLIYSKAANSQFKHPLDLASIHVSWTESLLQMSDESALEHIEDVLFNHVPLNHKKIKLSQASVPVQARVFKCTELWKFYIDLLKALLDDKNPEFVWNKLHAAYQQMLDLEVITLGLIFDYASFLKEQKSQDRAMALYEEALRHFQAPAAQFELWEVYLKDILKGSANLERIRHLFEQCLSGIPLPGHLVKSIFDMYIAFEEKNGQVMKSSKLLERAIAYLTAAYDEPVVKYTKQELNKIVDDKFDYQLQLLTRIEKLKDPQLTRTTLQAAAEDVQYSMPQLLELGLRFVRFEISRREIVRSRSLFKHFVLLGNPESHLFAEMWSAWEKFEVQYGVEQLFKEMLKYKRQLAREFVEVEQAKQEVNPLGFVKGETKGGEIKPKAVENPDAIDLDMDM